MVKGASKLVIGKEAVAFEDLKRLEMSQWINDEIVNTCQAILIHQFESVEDFHFWVATSFFYEKLNLWYQLKNGPAKFQEFKKLQQFYQKQQVSQILYCAYYLTDLT